MKRLENKVAIITGGGSGQGKAAAEIFASEGAKIVIADWNAANGKEVENDLRESGYDVLFVETDVSSEGSVKNMVDITLEAYGTVDVLFNNAGIGYSENSRYKMADLVETPLADWNGILSI